MGNETLGNLFVKNEYWNLQFLDMPLDAINENKLIACPT